MTCKRVGECVNRIWQEIENKIEREYVSKENEWVQVDVSKRGKVHVMLVSDSEEATDEAVKQIVQEIIEQRQNEYRVGFVNIYTTEEAEKLTLSKQEKKAGGIYSWKDSLYAEVQYEEKKKDTQVISFYSYKGGVGRTIALIQTAYNLAQAGKKILLLDLDIEAPSLHNIFEEEIADEINGVKYGVIEYLYKKLVEKSNSVSEEDIFCHLQLDEIPGEIYVIPACREMNKEYIYQMEKIQTQKIQEQEIFEGIFSYLKERLDVDMILVDTRAGFNHWGSLSLLSLSDQVIFVAYPNRENIEGLNIAFGIMKNIGKKRYAVAMSKVVASDEGVTKASQLFDRLQIDQEQIIPIYYKEEIALCNKYPIEDEEVLSAYRDISAYILNNERIERNMEFLSGGRKEELLKTLFKEEKNFVKLLSIRRFLEVRGATVLKYHFAEELYGLNESLNQAYSMKEYYVFPTNVYTYFNKELTEFYKMRFSCKVDNYIKLGMQLISENIIHSNLPFDKDKIPSNDMMPAEFLKCLECEISADNIYVLGDAEKEDRIIAQDSIRVIVELTEEILRDNPEIVLENMKGLITAFNREIPEIQFKFIIKNEVLDKYLEWFGSLKGNIAEVRVMQVDIERFILNNINESAFELFQKVLAGYQEHDIYEANGMVSPSEREILQLVLGIRKQVKKHSSSIVEYLMEWLKKYPEQRYDIILDCLKKAARYELEHMDKKGNDRLISFRNLERELMDIC